MYLCLVSVLNKLFLWKLSHLWYCVSNKKNFAPVFTVFASLKNSYFEIEERAKETLPLASTLAGLVARISGFHPGYPGSILGKGTKFLIQATAHCCLSDINTTGSD